VDYLEKQQGAGPAGWYWSWTIWFIFLIRSTFTKGFFRLQQCRPCRGILDVRMSRISWRYDSMPFYMHRNHFQEDYFNQPEFFKRNAKVTLPLVTKPGQLWQDNHRLMLPINGYFISTTSGNSIALVILNPLSYYYFFHRFVTCKFDNFHPSRLIMDDSINSTKKEKNFTLAR